MNKRLIAGFLGAVVLAPVFAHAGGVWAVVGTIDHYEDYGTGPQIKIAGDTGSGTANPAACSQGATRYIVPSPSLTQSQLDHLQRVLLEAHLSRRPVSIKLRNDQCASDGNRVYYAVLVN